MIMNNTAALLSEYKKLERDISKRLEEFRLSGKKDDEYVFGELCFCLMTANANALKCDEALKALRASGLHIKGSPGRIKPHLLGRCRFHNKKSEYIVGARTILSSGKRITVKSRIDAKDVIKTRDWFVDNIKGLGFKEASHFLRNIGLGDDIAILDRHILKNLKDHGVIDKIPDSVGSRKVYVAIEDKMRDFSRDIGIPLSALDLLFWAKQTGFIFK